MQDYETQITPSSTGEKRSLAGSILAQALAAACLLVIGAFGGLQYAKSAKPPTPPKQAAQTIPVNAAVATKQPFNPEVDYVGHVEAALSVDIIPEVQGYIKKVCFKEGKSVKEGELLYEIDDERYLAIMHQREAELETAKAERDRAERYLKRLQNTDQKAITQTSMDAAISGAASAKAAVLQCEANIALARYDLKRTKIHASISGFIGKSSVYQGDFVSPSKGPIARIVQSDPIRVTFPMTDREYINFRQIYEKSPDSLGSRRIRLQLPNGTLYSEKGTWDFNDNEMSASTATIQVRLNFPNPNALLVPNTFVTVKSDLAKPPTTLVVPEKAICDFPGGGLGVWVVSPENSTVTQKHIQTGETFGGLTSVLSGLNQGEIVIVDGTQRLVNGMKVQIANNISKK